MISDGIVVNCSYDLYVCNKYNYQSEPLALPLIYVTVLPAPQFLLACVTPGVSMLYPLCLLPASCWFVRGMLLPEDGNLLGIPGWTASRCNQEDCTVSGELLKRLNNVCSEYSFSVCKLQL